MSLSVGLDIARKGLASTAEQTSVVSRNVTSANDPLTARKIAQVVSAPGGGSQLISVTRATNLALFDKLLGSTSDAETQKAITAALDKLGEVIGDPESSTSPGALVGKLNAALGQFAANPADVVSAQSVVTAATTLARSLQDASAQIRDVRSRADTDMQEAVVNINDLLSKFDQVNTEIIKGTRSGTDVTDLEDSRDKLLSDLSSYIGVRTLRRADGDVAIYTDSGVPLYESKPRPVTFDRTLLLTPSGTGNPVLVDGIPITGSNSAMRVGSGKLAGLATVRDDLTTTFQTQVDEIARGLITVFAEKDPSGSGAVPDAPGLFTWSGAPAVPAAGAAINGLASDIKVNPAVDRTQGGNPLLLRDGGINGSQYVVNTTGAAGYSDNIQSLITSLQNPMAFDTNAQIGTSKTVGDFAAQSAGWLSQLRKTTTAEASYRQTVADRAGEALSKETGVNLDDEMTKLLELERSYQASSKLVSVIGDMFQTFVQALR